MSAPVSGSTERDRASRFRRLRVAIGILLIILVAKVFFNMSKSQLSAGPMEVAHVGFTNDAAGNRLASFSIMNGWDRRVYLDKSCHVYMQSDLKPSWTGGSRMSAFVEVPEYIPSGKSHIVFLPMPTNQTQWCVGVRVATDKSTLKARLSTLAEKAQLNWMAGKLRAYKYGINSGWITPEEDPD